MSGKKRPRRHYTTDFKLKVIHEIESGELNAWSARKKYSIPGKMTVKRWLERFEKSHLMLRKKREQPDYLAVSRHADKIEELKDRNRILEAALAEAQVRVLALESLVEVVDEEYKTNVKKNFGSEALKRQKRKRRSITSQ